MNVKKNLLRAVKILSLIIAVALTAALLQEYVLCRADHNRQRLKGFFMEEQDSIDMVIMGASEVYSDFAPGYSYSRDGLTSYLFATQSNSILNYKAQLKNILKRQNPSLIVIEVNGALYGDEEEVTKEENLHNYADNVPLDTDKLDWIINTPEENKQEYLFPLIKFHGVWNDIGSQLKYNKTIIDDKLRGYTYLKGILNETGIFQSTQRSMNASLPKLANSKKPLTEVEENGLRDLLEFCKSEGLKNVVFARFPHIVVQRTYSRFERGNALGDIINEYGYDYLNFELNFAQTGLDETTDFYNLDHLNVYGQKKFTAYLTDYLKQNYSLAPRTHSESCDSRWETCADYYDAYYSYSDNLIKKGETRELSEDCELIETLNEYL